MKLETARPNVYRLTLHAYELAALVSAVRWVADGEEGDLPPEAVQNLRALLDDYERASSRLRASPLEWAEGTDSGS